MRYLIILVVTLLITCLPDHLHAQITVELDSISVTASRISTNISESGKSVSVFTQDQIKQMPATSVDELLRTLPGVNINSRSGFGVQADVGIRGSTFTQVLFMLDNVPLNDPLTGHFNTNIPVSLSEIGQIELIRGPASTSYGADAVGGVVHIKTKMYMEREIQSVSAGETLSRTFADVSLGQNGLFMTDASVELQTQKWRFSVSARDARSDGETYRNPGFAEGVSENESFNTFFNLTNVSAAVSHRFNNKLSWYIRGGANERDFNARYFYTRSIFDESTEEISNKWGLTALTYNSGKHRAEINASYRKVNDIFDFNSSLVPANKHTTGLLFLNASHQYSFFRNTAPFNSLTLLTGGQYLKKSIESTDRGNHNNDSGGLYAIATASLQNGFNVTGSLRLQFSSVGETHFLPQLSAAFKVSSFNFRTSVGRAVRSGDFTERFISSEIPNLTPLRNIGNPDLRSEKSTTFDTGFDWTPTRSFRFSPTFFIRNSKDLIDYAITNSSLILNADNLLENEEYFYAQNITSATSTGIELLIDSRILNAQILSLNARFGYTYIYTTSDQETVSKYIANHPEHQVQFGLNLSSSQIRISTQSTYYVRSNESADIVNADIPSTYFVSNLNISYSPAKLEGLRFYSRVLNITDTDYQEILGAPMPGRWFSAGIQLDL